MGSTTENLFSLHSRGFRHAAPAIFLAGIANFAALYCVQPLLPTFAERFGVSAGNSSLALSLTTGALGLAGLWAGDIAGRIGKKRLMSLSLLLSALLVMVGSLAPNWDLFLISRALLGVSLSGLPAVIIGYIHEEMADEAVGLGVGLYVSGCGTGGMLGRMGAALITDYVGFRWGLAVIGMGSLLLSWVVVAWLPKPVPRPSQGHNACQRPRRLAVWRSFFQDPALPGLFAIGFCLMAIFVTFYDYLPFRLEAAPYRLTEVQIALIFSVYAVGIFSASAMGYIAGHFGRRKVLWLALSMLLIGILLSFSTSLWLIILGAVLVTFAFFGSHSIASSWVGYRAPDLRTEASAFYLLCFYLASAVVGTGAGLIWSHWHWTGVASLLTILATGGLGLARHLAHVPPRRPVSLYDTSSACRKDKNWPSSGNRAPWR